MYSDMERLTTEYEQRINKLWEKIREHEAQIEQYKALLEDKDYHINLLYTENQELKAQIQNFQQSRNLSSEYTPQLHPPPDLSQTVQPTRPTRTITTTMARQCPNCGASGFAIREIDDKSQIISYIPRRIYAKKKHCTKCGFEF